MINVTIYKNRNDEFVGFGCLGHAEFAEAGEDVVCAGVSTLVINTINSLGIFTTEKFTTDSDEETGLISMCFQNTPGHDAELLIKSMVLGLQGIQNNYGNEYIILNFKEV